MTRAIYTLNLPQTQSQHISPNISLVANYESIDRHKNLHVTAVNEIVSTLMFWARKDKNTETSVTRMHEKKPVTSTNMGHEGGGGTEHGAFDLLPYTIPALIYIISSVITLRSWQ